MKSELFFKIIIAIVMIGSLNACLQPQYGNEINEIDQMLDSLEITQGKLAQINFDTCLKIKRTINGKIDFVNKHYAITGDTVTLEIGILLGKYKDASKAFTRVEKNYNKINDELNYTMNQMKSLRKALKSEVYDKTQTSAYFTEEKQAFQAINFAADKLLNGTRAGSHLFNEHKEQINVLINDLQSEKEALWELAWPYCFYLLLL